MPESEARGTWAAVPEAQDAYSERSGRFATEQADARDSGGVEVRLGPRARERERARRAREARRRTGGRGILVAVGVLVLAGLVTIGLVLTPGSGNDERAQAGEAGPNLANVEPPPAGEPVEIGTADGFTYRLATVRSGLNEEAVTASQTSLPSGTSYPYIDYLLTNPTDQEVLLEYPGDIFVERELVTADARGRCEPQGGAPEDWCTPPTESAIVQRLAGGELAPGAGGDKYMPPGSTYLVRITVQVPVDRDVTSEDMGLYVWNQIFLGTEPAKPVPFPG